MALVKYCPYCRNPVHYLMPWMKNWRKIVRGKFKGRFAHKKNSNDKCRYGD